MPRILVDTTPLKESKDFQRLWWGLGVSNFGHQMTAFAVALEVFDITKSTLHVGFLGLAGLIPLVVLGLYGGALVDAFDRRKISLLASTVLWSATILLAIQAFMDLHNVYVLYALVALQSAAFAVNNPARQAILPRLVRIELIPAANALMTTLWTIALMGGPFAAALLVDNVGYGWTYAVDAVLFTAALYAIWRLPSIKPGEDPAQSGALANTSEGSSLERDSQGVESPKARKRVGLSSVLDGFRYLKTQPDVRMTFLVDLAAMILAMPRVLFPAIGMIVLGGGATTVAILTAALAGGTLLAGVFSGIFSRATRHGAIIVGAISAWALSVTAFGVVIVAAGRTEPSEPLWNYIALAAVALAVGGASDEISAIFRQTILQTATPDHMRGRLQGIFIVVVAGGPRLSELWIGAQATWWGEGMAALIGGLSCLVVLWLLVAGRRQFLAYDSRNVAKING